MQLQTLCIFIAIILTQKMNEAQKKSPEVDYVVRQKLGK